jgi:hypothetical protein
VLVEFWKELAFVRSAEGSSLRGSVGVLNFDSHSLLTAMMYHLAWRMSGSPSRVSKAWRKSMEPIFFIGQYFDLV